MLSHLPEHPSDGLLHEVVSSVEMYLGIAQTPGRITILCRGERANHTDTLPPQMAAMGQSINDFALLPQVGRAHQPSPDDLRSRGIDKIPVVDSVGMMEVEVDDFVALADGFDPDYEASLWIGPDGHGANGAPYHIRDILDDMDAVQSAYNELADAFRPFVTEF